MDENSDPILPPASSTEPADNAAHALVVELPREGALRWDQLSDDERAVLIRLGYSELTWNRGAASYMEELSWDDDAETAAATATTSTTSDAAHIPKQCSRLQAASQGNLSGSTWTRTSDMHC